MINPDVLRLIKSIKSKPTSFLEQALDESLSTQVLFPELKERTKKKIGEPDLKSLVKKIEELYADFDISLREVLYFSDLLFHGKIGFESIDKVEKAVPGWENIDLERGKRIEFQINRSSSLNSFLRNGGYNKEPVIVFSKEDNHPGYLLMIPGYKNPEDLIEKRPMRWGSAWLGFKIEPSNFYRITKIIYSEDSKFSGEEVKEVMIEVFRAKMKGKMVKTYFGNECPPEKLLETYFLADDYILFDRVI